MQKTILRGIPAGVAVSLGATIPEFFYTYIGLKFLHFFISSLLLSHWIKVISIGIFLALGVFHLSRKRKKLVLKSKIHDKLYYHDFLHGTVIGFMNMLIIPYWVLIGTMLESSKMHLSYPLQILWFSVGAAIGALLVFLIYTWLAKFLNSRIQAIARYVDRAVGILFFALALVQLAVVLLNQTKL